MPEPKKALYPELIVRNKQPQNFLEEDLSLFQAALSEKIPASHYRHLQNALLLKDTVFRGFKFWQEYSQITPLNSKSKLKRLLLGLFKKNKIEKGIWITDNWSNAYFHWLTDSMSRLIAIDPLISGHKVLLPKNYKDFGYIKESLDLLNYQYEFLEDKAPCLVHDLLLPSHIAPTGNFQPDVINKVREKFLSLHNLKKPFRKIFISREKAKARKLINEDQFSSQLKNLGFEIHMFEEYSLAEQIKLMTECSFLAGLHGAGLTNMLFMQKGTTVIELRKSDDDLNNCYFSMASALELNYYYIKCKTDHTITQRANFEIPEEGINNFINIFSEDFSETQRKS